MGLRILVLEDDEMLQHTWQRVLRRKGHEVRVSATLTEFRARMAEAVPDLVLLDRQLFCEDGWSARHEVPDTVRVVLMTGNPPPDAPPHYLKANPQEELFALIDGAQLEPAPA